MPATDVWGILPSMLIHRKISLGRLRDAYSLTVNQAEAVIRGLWPHSVFPLELWHNTFDTCWKEFAVAHKTGYELQPPTLPQSCRLDKQCNTFLLALEVQEFFRRLSFVIPVRALMLGLTRILEEAYEDVNTVFQNERKMLFDDLQRLENEEPYEQYSPDSPLFEEQILAIPASHYHFITYIFLDTILVDRDAAIKYLGDCPLHREMKGITRSLVASIAAVPAIVPVADTENQQAHAEVLPVEQTDDGKLTFRIPSSVWLGRPDEAVKEAMVKIYPLPVVAYVLFHWCGQPEVAGKHCGGRKTRIGRLLTDKEYSDTKSYRNLVDALLKDASAYHILKN